MNEINRAVGLPTADEAVALDQKAIADAAARGRKPGKVGEGAGTFGIGIASAPLGLLGGGAVMGGLLSEARPEDVSGFAKDVGVGAVTSKVGGEAINATLKGIGNAGARALTKNVDAQKTVTALRDAKNAAYERMKALNINYRPDAIDGLMTDIGRTFARFRAHPENHEAAFNTLNQMADDVAGRPVSMSDLDNWRAVIIRDVSAKGGSVGELGNKMVRDLNKFMDNAGGDAMAMGGTDVEKAATAQQGKLAIDAARAANKQYRNVELVDRKMQSALSKAKRTYSGGNIDNRVRQTLGPLIDPDSPQNITRFLKPDELQTLTDVVHGTQAQNIMRHVGELSPLGGGMKALMSAGAASATHGLSVPFTAAGLVSKIAANAATKGRVANLIDLMASGGTKEGQLAARQLRAEALKNTNVAKWLKAVGLDIGEGANIAATAGAVKARQPAVTVESIQRPDGSYVPLQ
jgi:hypothetical protein